ncbi:hypothetical protein ILUMI_06990 [Ignelater luminosus]|uniref:Uncharacterized protein n=1 Tax=Ignelater luminosus TaxID=2038154 RepID=A0A8K0GET9_IGNLU|nr:hypothetical protein ILUMI_06990 [Ignelater luminosus]
MASAELEILREKIIEAVNVSSLNSEDVQVEYKFDKEVNGNEIILQSMKIREACYMSEWVNCGPSVRKTLFIIMERTKRPLKLYAGGFISLSLDTLVSVS